MRKVCLALLTFAALAANATTGKTVIVSPEEKAAETRDSDQQFKCEGGLRVMDKEAIQDIAYTEYRRLGGSKAKPDVEFAISSRGCNWLVLINPIPRIPGGDIGVVIDARTGKVTESSRGM